MTEQQVINELHHYAKLRGIKELDARRAIDRAKDKRALLRRWKQAHSADTRRIAREFERKALERMAEVNAENHLALKERQRQRREFARGQLRLGQRLDVAVAEAECLSGVSSAMGAFGERVKGGAFGSPAHHPEPLEDLETHLFVIRARVQMIEQDLDHYRGLGPAAQSTQMTGAEKDALIVSKEMEGRSPEAIAEAFPWLGSPLTIRRKRKEHGLRGGDGTPTPKSIYQSSRNAA